MLLSHTLIVYNRSLNINAELWINIFNLFKTSCHRAVRGWPLLYGSDTPVDTGGEDSGGEVTLFEVPLKNSAFKINLLDIFWQHLQSQAKTQGDKSHHLNTILSYLSRIDQGLVSLLENLLDSLCTP